MLSRLHTAHSIIISIARISMVALLMIVLLAGLIPSGALSAAHVCKMACCAGKPTHEAGECNAALPNTASDEAVQTTEADEHQAHHGEMAMAVAVDETVAETEASSDHCQTAGHSSAQHPASRQNQTQQRSVAAHAFNRPCAPDCAAAVLTLVQLRRPREAAAHSIAAQPRPPTLHQRASLTNSLLPSSAERRRQSRPRAPPRSLVNLSA